jgi:hypothetical protein
VAGALVAACASTPPPDWQLNAKAALERATIAHLSGNTRAEVAELESARREIARTGRVDLLVRAELAYCAARVAGLAFEPCAPFERLRDDAPAAERAYADYLDARLQAADVALLPPAQRAAATASASSPALVLQSIDDPLSRLVAAAVMLRSARADPTVMAIAVDTASAQGWRRPLLGWLKLQLELAEKAGAAADADRLRRRIALVQGEYAVVPKPH